MDNEFPNDPDWIEWLEARHAEAVEAMESEAAARHQAKSDYWINKTIEAGDPPC